MSAVTVALVIASAFVHAAWNALLKRAREPENAVVSVLAVSAASAAVVAVVLGTAMPPPASLFWCVASGVLEAGYFVTLARALTRAPLGPVYTVVRGGGLVLVWPLAIAILHERLSLVTAAGVALVVLGLAATGAGDMQRDTRAGALAKNLGWAAVCAVFVAGYQIAYKLALARGGAAPSVVAVSLGSASVVNLLTLGRRRALLAWSALRAEPAKVIAAGVLANVGFVVFLTAMARSGAGVVITLRNTSILFAQLFAALQGDRPKRLGIVGAVLVTLGAALLAR